MGRWLLTFFAAAILTPLGCYVGTYSEYPPQSEPEYSQPAQPQEEPVREETIEETREKHYGPYEPVVPGK
jgi:hypothetical protein